MLKHGKNYEWYLQLQAEGKSIPALDSKPELYTDLIPIWNAFITVSQTEVTLREIQAYLELYEIPKELHTYFVKWILFIHGLSNKNNS